MLQNVAIFLNKAFSVVRQIKSIRVLRVSTVYEPGILNVSIYYLFLYYFSNTFNTPKSF